MSTPSFDEKDQLDIDTIHDVIIIGAGPAGSMLACCLSRLGIKPIVFDCDPFPHEWGRGDGLMPRTVEVLSQLGNGHPNTSVGDLILSRSTLINGFSGYSSKGTNSLQPGNRQFMLQLLDIDQQCIYGIRQGIIEKTLLEDVEKTSTYEKKQIFRPFRFISFDLIEDTSLIKVHLINDKTGEKITVKSKFLIGADGGKSLVRKCLHPFGDEFIGNSPESLWCAIDFVGIRTNFPDNRIYCLMENKSGNLMLIPREPIKGKECFRLYVQIDSIQDDQILTRETVTFDHAINAVKKALHPYTLEWDEINWFTSYPIGQRIASKFDVDNRIFLIGDACHTHSPKGGLGMNTSMMDAHNLSWKLALVLKTISPQSLLSTYNEERRSVAEKLLEYDTANLKIFEQIKTVDCIGKSKLVEQFEELEKRNSLYHMGVGILYEPNLAISNHVDPLLVGVEERSRIKTGSRILPSTVRKFKDLRVVNFLSELFFDLRFRIIVLIGDLTREENKIALKLLSDQLANPTSFVTKHDTQVQTNTYDLYQEKAVERVENLFDFKTITTTSSCDPRLNSERDSNLALLKQRQSPLFDDKSIYCDEVPAISSLDYLMFKGKWFPPEKGQDAQIPPLEILPFQLHQRWDIDPIKGGAIIVTRPDGHIAVATTFDVDNLNEETAAQAWQPIQAYFDKILV